MITFSMRSNDTYILQLFVQKCKINIQESGSVGLLLRAGKNQSHVTNLQPIVKGVINFNTLIKLNIDSSALDTKRCTLTLNFVSSSNAKKVIGIVVINIPDIGEEVQKTFKVTSTPDKQAEIQLIISVKQLNDSKVVKQQMKQKQKSTQSYKNGSFASNLISLNSKSQDTPTSPPSQTNEKLDKLNLKSKRSQVCDIESIGQTEELQATIDKLQRQKRLLKELLKLQMAKSNNALSHLKNIIEVLQLAIGVNNGNHDLSIRSTIVSIQTSFPRKSSIDGLDMNKFSLSSSTPGLRTSNLSTVKETIEENLSPNPQNKRNANNLKLNKSQINNTNVGQILNSLRNKMQDVGKSKADIQKLFQKIDAKKIQTLKTRIDKSYLQLLCKQQITKEEILKQKIDVNKILDEIVNPLVK